MLLAAAFLALVLAFLALPADASQRATVEEVTSARMIAAARLRQFADEREERFRRYHRGWSGVAGRRDTGRGYVVEFRAAGGRRG